MLTQCLFLASYPAIYKNNLTWYLTSLSYAPPVFVWLFLVLSKKANLDLGLVLGSVSGEHCHCVYNSRRQS